LLLVALPPGMAGAAELKPEAVAAWAKYERLTEARIRKDLETDSAERASNTVLIRKMVTPDERGIEIDAKGAMIHHWKGSLLIPSARIEQVLRFSQDYDRHQKFFPEVEKSRLVARAGDSFKIFYRLKRTKVLTVVYNTEHTVDYTRRGSGGASSRSVATRIAELEDPGTKDEHEKPPDRDHGFLWRLNSYWRFSEREGGVLVECESISLSGGIPFGLAWLIKGYVESVPRESLLNTLTSLRDGVRGAARAEGGTKP